MFTNALNTMSWFCDENLGLALMKFAAMRQSLKNPSEICEVFHEVLDPLGASLPWQLKSLFRMEKFSPSVTAKCLDAGLWLAFRPYLAGNGRDEICRFIRKRSREGMHFNFDILGETVTSEKQAGDYVRSYLSLITDIAPLVPRGDLSISLKPSAFYSQGRPEAPEYAAREIVAKVGPIVSLLQKIGGHAYLDAENYEMLEVQKLVFKELYIRHGSAVRFVLQAYLSSVMRTLDWLISLNDARDPITLRLVRGAYWDQECFQTEKLGREEPPVLTEKCETDVTFSGVFFWGTEAGLKIIPGTHNCISISNAVNSIRVLEEKGKHHEMPEFQVLLGMGEEIAEEMMGKGYEVRFYCPVQYPRGSLQEAMAYFMRRILENRSQMSFLKQHTGDKRREMFAVLDRIPLQKEEKRIWPPSSPWIQ